MAKQKQLKKGNDRSVVKSNRLNSAIHNLSLEEIRLIQYAIVEARETGAGFSVDRPLRIHASEYAEAFNITRDRGYVVLMGSKDPARALVRRTFVFIDRKDGLPVESNWLQQVKYLPDEGAVELVFTEAVAREISNLDGKKGDLFTQYALKQTAPLRSVYAVRLYELLVQWLSNKGTPVMDLVTFRRQMEISPDLYPRITNLRVRVIEPALALIRKHSNLDAKYELIKQGRTITGIVFKDIKRSDKEEVAAIEAADALASQKAEQGRGVGGDDAEEGIVLTQKQAQTFARMLVNDSSSGFSALIPTSCATAVAGIAYVTEKLQSDPAFVRRAAKYLRRIGFSGRLP